MIIGNLGRQIDINNDITMCFGGKVTIFRSGQDPISGYKLVEEINSTIKRREQLTECINNMQDLLQKSIK